MATITTFDIVREAAFATGSLLHGGTGTPVSGAISISAPEVPFKYRILPEGVFALSGPILQFFPDLATQSYDLHVTVDAVSQQFQMGKARITATLSLPAGSDFDPQGGGPGTPPVDLGTLLFVPDAVEIRGRVVKAKEPYDPIKGAQIDVLKGKIVLDSATTDGKGSYRFAPLVLSVDGPTYLANFEIRCKAGGFNEEKRHLLVDYGSPVQEESFRMAIQ